MSTHELAGQAAPASLLVNIPRLVSQYYALRPDPNNPLDRVAFGTSGHRGTSGNATFTDWHIAAVSQAVAEYRANQGIRGPLYLGMDSHALSEPAWITALEVLAANGVEVRFQRGRGYTPTPLISYAILTHNKNRTENPADGIVITPSHNPPEDGGFKYNPPNGGPADTNITKAVQERANQLLASGEGIKRVSLQKALKSPNIQPHDFVMPYVQDLLQVVDMAAIKAAGVKIGVDPMGGASLPVWQAVQEQYGLNLEVVNTRIDPTFGFMTMDKDGKIRMDCSSPFAMAGLLGLKDQFDIAIGNDPDADRHGIVTKDGLMNPNHYLAVCIHYLFGGARPQWGAGMGIGKTLVSSSIIDRVAAGLSRNLIEVPVGFKYFVEGLSRGTLGFGGEESAGASFQRMDGSAWSTDKDGITLGLLAAEVVAKTGKSPSQHYRDLEAKYGSSAYSRMDATATPEQKKVLANLSPEMVTASSLAGEAITAKLTKAPGNGEAIGGLKVTTENAWFAARPSGTENVYKIYAESFKGKEHLEQVIQEAQQVVGSAFRAAGL